MDEARKYQFSWDLLGNIELGRPNLGPYTRLEIYRLMQFTFRDVIEAQYGTQAADEVFYAAGKLAGAAFYQHHISQVEDLNAFIRKLQGTLKEMGVGILRLEKADAASGEFILTVSEDLDCSGLPELGHGVCTYDEGFIAALMECFSGQKFEVKEVDCWCTGDRTCRFTARAVG